MRRLGGGALAAAVVLTAALAAQPLAHDDLFVHLAAGGRIAATGAVPTVDFLSHTRAGAPWVSHEWGFSLAAWGVYRAGGFPALLALKVALALALFGGVALLARRLAGADAALGLPFAGALAVALAWAVSRELILRAALAGALCFAGCALLLLAFRARPSRWRGAVVVALVLVWANLHSGVVFGLFLVALFALEALVARRGAAAWLGLAAACLAAAFANPNGVEALLYPFRLALLLADPASGFTPGHFAGGWVGRQGLLGLLVLAAALGWLLRLRQRGEAERHDWRAGLPAAWLAATAVFAALSWKTDRLALELVVLAAPAAYALWAGWAAKRGGGGNRAVAVALPALALFAAAVVTWGVLSFRPPGVVSPAFPWRATDLLAERGVEGRLFHHQNWGGFLHWRLGVPIFWDGRNDVFAPVVKEVGTTPFHRVAERYGIGTLVLSPREVRDLRPVLASGGWQLIHVDGTAAVFVRREAGGEGHPL